MDQEAALKDEIPTVSGYDGLGRQVQGDFEPGPHTKSMLLGTRKQQRRIGGIEFPGLFSTEQVVSDVRWIWGVGILEMIGLIALYYVVWDSTELSALAVFGICGVAILCDCVFAVLHHFLATPKQCEIANEKLLFLEAMRSPDERKLRYTDYMNLNRFKIPTWKQIVVFGASVIIVILSIIKAISLVTWLPQQLTDTIKTIIIVPCLLSYFIVAYIHLTHTGYWTAYRRYILSYNRDLYRYNDKEKAFQRKPFWVDIDMANFIEDMNNTEFSTIIPDDADTRRQQVENGLKTIQVHSHTITYNSANNKYRFTIMGRLLDSELQRMVELQHEGLAQAAVALYGHYLQWRNLKALDENAEGI